LGGTFDPIHMAHLFMGELAADELDLSRVIYMPARVPPHKSGESVTSSHHRLSMSRLAVEDAPAFEVSDMELARPAPSYTIDTVRELLATLQHDASLYLIIGSDSLLELDSWKDHAELLTMVRLAVYPRPGYPATTGRTPWSDRALLLPGEDLTFNLSSSAIRDRVRSGRSIRYLVPRAVERYISEHGLYGRE